MEALEQRLGQTPQNSSRPPSTVPPDVKRSPQKPSTGRKPGGQPGHEAHQRPLFPPEQVTSGKDHWSKECEDCGQLLPVGAARRIGLADTLGKFAVGAFQDSQNIVDIRPRIVVALMPALGALLQSLVVTVLALFNQPLQADVAPDFVTRLVGLQQPQQPRHPAIPVTERVDA